MISIHLLLLSFIKTFAIIVFLKINVKRMRVYAYMHDLAGFRLWWLYLERVARNNHGLINLWP